MQARLNAPLAYPALRQVRLCDDRFAPWIEQICTITVPDVLDKFTEDGAIENYARVAAGLRGGHSGYPWFHGLICECIRGISDLLVHHYDAAVDARLDTIIDAIGRALDADPDGFLDPYTTLMCPKRRWGRNGGNISWQHETYNAGCLIEAGVHHYLATGKTALLACAVRNANFLAANIGEPPRHNVVAEHSLPEEALVKLYRLLADRPALAAELGAKPEEYLRVACYMIDHKGDNATRYTEPKYGREYAQDHRPTREQTEAIGHAVRANLFYTGIAAAACETGDRALAETCRTIWDDVVETKLHANGCVGAIKHEEKYGPQYSLPNNAYLETCAGVALGFWGGQLFRLMPDASIWDTVESMICNVLPASLGADFVHYTYENPLEARDYTRWSWHKCPCCPPMFLKFVGELPRMVYAQSGSDIWLNLYIDSDYEGDACALSLRNGRLTVTPKADRLTLRLRVPAWARNWSVSLGGEAIDAPVIDGYAVISRPFAPGDVLMVTCDTPIVKYAAHPYVSADHGRVIVKRGPVLYCAEAIDNDAGDDWDALDFTLGKGPLALRADGSIIGARTDGRPAVLIPYPNWGSRGVTMMRTWFRQAGHHSDPCDTSGWEKILYRSFAEYPTE